MVLAMRETSDIWRRKSCTTQDELRGFSSASTPVIENFTPHSVFGRDRSTVFDAQSKEASQSERKMPM